MMGKSLHAVDDPLSKTSKLKTWKKMKLHFLSKYRYIREGETNSKYFLSWKSPDTLAKNIKSVMNSTAKLIHSQQEI